MKKCPYCFLIWKEGEVYKKISNDSFLVRQHGMLDRYERKELYELISKNEDIEVLVSELVNEHLIVYKKGLD